MKPLFSFLFYLFLSLNIAAGQNPNPHIFLKSFSESSICAYSENKLPADIIGVFNSNNKFKVEQMIPYTDEVIASYEATYKDGGFYFRIEQDIPREGREVSWRVSSSDPAIHSNVLYGRPFFNRGVVSIRNARGTVDTLNAGANLLLDFNATTNNPVNVTLSDSSKIEIPYTNSTYTLSFPAFETKDIFIVKAVNSCNIPVPFSGKASVAINAVSILPGKINNPALCEGSDVELTYSTSGGMIPASASFKLRFFKLSYSDPNENRIFEIPAVKKEEGVLTGRIPEKMIRYSVPYQVAVMVDNPGLMSPYSEQFLIHEKPVATFRYQSDSARVGEAYDLYFNVSGLNPIHWN